MVLVKDMLKALRNPKSLNLFQTISIKLDEFLPSSLEGESDRGIGERMCSNLPFSGLDFENFHRLDSMARCARGTPVQWVQSKRHVGRYLKHNQNLINHIQLNAIFF